MLLVNYFVDWKFIVKERNRKVLTGKCKIPKNITLKLKNKVHVAWNELYLKRNLHSTLFNLL